jgi:hypothetical protein
MANPSQANVTISTMTFNDWVSITNQLATQMANTVVTANTTLGITAGNAYVNGIFSANTLAVIQGLRGGNNSASNTLPISSDFLVNAVANFTGIKVSLATSTAGQTLDSFTTTTLRTAKYIIQISNNSTGYQSSEILLLQDGTNAYITEYAQLNNGSQLGVFSATVSAGTVSLLVSPNTSTASASVVNIQRTALTV